MADSLPLITTRFHIPPLRNDLVLRPRLQVFLDQGAHLPLTLVSASPGFGKTMLAAQWVHRRAEGQVAWLSLADADNQPAIFWRYVFTALQRVKEGVGATALTMLAASSMPPIEVILASFINDLATAQDSLLLVLDDYHLIQHSDVHAGMRFLLDNQPNHFHVMILTREDPPLGLARRRAHRQMVEIRAADLRFSLDEAAVFLKDIMQLSLTHSQIGTLENRTEGWIVGLQMAALSLQGRDPQGFLEAFTGDNRYVADYLIEEVLQAQPEQVSRFLLRTSILERMCEPLITVVTGEPVTKLQVGNVSFLDYLDRANLFLVPLDHQHKWYRYHHLFAELLKQRLSQHLSKEEIAELHRRASGWFEANGDITSAVQHAKKVLDQDLVVSLLTRYAGQFFVQGELLQLIELTQDLPADQRENNPILSMAVAWALLATNQSPQGWLESIEHHFGCKAEAALEEPGLDPDQRRALLEVLILRQQPAMESVTPQSRSQLLAIQKQLKNYSPDQRCLLNTVADLEPVVSFDLGLMAELTGDIAFAETVFKETTRLARQTHNDHLLFLTLGHLANIQTVLGHLDAARQAHEQSLGARAAGGELAFKALAYAGLSALHYEWGDLTAASDYFDKGLPLARSWNYWEALVPLTMGQAQLQRRLGDKELAAQLLLELGEPQQPELRLPLAAKKAWWRAQDGDCASAMGWLEGRPDLLTEPPTPLTEPVLLDVARLLGQCGRLDQAITILDRIIAHAEAEGRRHILIQGKIVLAKMLQLEGQLEDAINALTEAIQLAAPEKYLSSFVDEGEVIQHLLAAIRSLPQTSNGLAAYLGDLLVGFSTDRLSPAPAQAESHLADLLSEREIEVLHLIADGLTNAEIADRLFISVSTVKTHAGNIFNKLGVTNRTQAISRSRELGLLP